MRPKSTASSLLSDMPRPTWMGRNLTGLAVAFVDTRRVPHAHTVFVLHASGVGGVPSGHASSEIMERDGSPGRLLCCFSFSV